jgi:DMSO/TMAO reductase YedYZ molybdopterin-dependent catalytic subunit
MEPDMEGKGWLKVLASGVLAGLVAAILMTLVLVLLREVLEIATPAELVGDRLAPRLSIYEFLTLLVRYGGYNELKQLGVSSVLGGQLAVGILGGVLYAIVVAWQRPRQSGQPLRRGIGRTELLFVGVFVGVLWLTILIVLWPVLHTHYGGLPRATATVVTMLAWLSAFAVYGIALMLLFGMMLSPASLNASARLPEPSGRRAILVGGIGVLATVATGGVLRRLYQRATFSYDGLRYRGPDIQPITPNDRFYIVSKNVIDPRITPSIWRLEVTGFVQQPRSYRYDDLRALPAITQETTLECISNEVGDGLMSNALWKGVPMHRLLEASGPQPGVVDVLLHAADGYTDTLTLEKAMHPTTLVVYEMNGEPLSPRHGYPVRIIVPGLFGKNHVKWVTRLELVNAHVKGFYAQQGWGPSFVIPTTSRFDQPAHEQTISMPVGATVPLKGIGFAGARGVSRIEVSLDNGQSWQEARIDYRGAPMAWILWSYDWTPLQAGRHILVVRATDGTGAVQTPAERNADPEGATGYHRITVRVET